LSKLQDRSGLNQSYYCTTCQVEYDPETELRSKTPLTMSEGPTKNPSIAYAPEAQLKRRKNEPRGSFKVLKDRGMNITNYSEKKFRRETSND
jgi:hypothetical protein